MIQLKVFVVGNTPKSNEVVKKLENILSEALTPHFKLEVIDIFENPEEVAAAGIFATPTLIKIYPGPERRIFGDLTDKKKVLFALGLVPKN